MMDAKNNIPFWKKCLRHYGALTGISILTIAAIFAITGYWIIPDPSPNANRMIPALGSRPPGFSITLLKIPIPDVPPTNLIEQGVNGKRDQYQYIPVTSWKKEGAHWVVQQFIDEGITKEVIFSAATVGENPFKQTTFWLGTDKFGRDMLSRLILGTRVSWSVGTIAVFISLLLGIGLGSIAGYYGGKIDGAVMWLVNVVWSMPTLLLVFAITLLLGKGFWQVFVAIGLSMWVNVARMVRGQVLATRELSYIEAARALGYSDSRIIIRHILPNIMGPIWVLAASNFASAIVMEAGLSFLGVGVQPPMPSWGLMLKENYNFIITNRPALALAPGIAIMLLVWAFNLLGNGLRDIMSVRT